MTVDLSVFSKFAFCYSPVAVKFMLARPPQVPLLEEKMAFCEMLKTAQDAGEAFCVSAANHACKAATYLLGMSEPDPVLESGQLGPKLGVFEDARANQNLYTKMSRLPKGTVNYIAYAPLSKQNFDPDLLIVTAQPSQAEIILRAYGYRTGSPWNAKGSSVVGCAWLYMYPYLSGEVNVMITGLHHGMKARQLFPEGLLFITIPYQVLPEIVANLQTMPWELPQYSWGKEAHEQRMKAIAAEVEQELRASDQ